MFTRQFMSFYKHALNKINRLQLVLHEMDNCPNTPDQMILNQFTSLISQLNTDQECPNEHTLALVFHTFPPSFIHWILTQKYTNISDLFTLLPFGECYYKDSDLFQIDSLFYQLDKFQLLLLALKIFSNITEQGCFDSLIFYEILNLNLLLSNNEDLISLLITIIYNVMNLNCIREPQIQKIISFHCISIFTDPDICTHISIDLLFNLFMKFTKQFPQQAFYLLFSQFTPLQIVWSEEHMHTLIGNILLLSPSLYPILPNRYKSQNIINQRKTLQKTIPYFWYLSILFTLDPDPIMCAWFDKNFSFQSWMISLLNDLSFDKKDEIITFAIQIILSLPFNEIFQNLNNLQKTFEFYLILFSISFDCISEANPVLVAASFKKILFSFKYVFKVSNADFGPQELCSIEPFKEFIIQEFFQDYSGSIIHEEVAPYIQDIISFLKEANS